MALCLNKIASMSTVDQQVVIADMFNGTIYLNQKGVADANHLIEGVTRRHLDKSDVFCILVHNTDDKTYQVETIQIDSMKQETLVKDLKDWDEFQKYVISDGYLLRVATDPATGVVKGNEVCVMYL